MSMERYIRVGRQNERDGGGNESVRVFVSVCVSLLSSLY